MKKRRNFIASLTTTVLLTGMTLNFGGCTKDSPMSSTADTDKKAHFQILAKKGGGGNGNNVDTGDGEASGPKTYSASYTVKRTKNGSYKGSGLFNIAGRWEVFAEVRGGSLDSYFAEQGINQVTITVVMIEELVTLLDGRSYYNLDFTFGPSGAHFEPEFQLKVDGRYVSTGVEIWLYDEYGVALEGRQEFVSDDQLVFYIPHFSRYAVAWSN